MTEKMKQEMERLAHADIKAHRDPWDKGNHDGGRVNGFLAGFTACHAIMVDEQKQILEDAEKLVAALKQYEATHIGRLNDDSFMKVENPARKAVNEWKEKYRG